MWDVRLIDLLPLITVSPEYLLFSSVLTTSIACSSDGRHNRASNRFHEAGSSFAILPAILSRSDCETSNFVRDCVHYCVLHDFDVSLYLPERDSDDISE